jgi:hypothetical protein
LAAHFCLASLARRFQDDQTLEHKKYASLVKIILFEVCVIRHDAGRRPLDRIETQGIDNTYRRFLNRYGDLTYSTFALADGAYLNAKGIYAHYAGTSCNTSDDAGIRRRSV